MQRGKNCITFGKFIAKNGAAFCPQWKHILGLMDNVINYFVGNSTSFPAVKEF